MKRYLFAMTTILCGIIFCTSCSKDNSKNIDLREVKPEQLSSFEESNFINEELKIEEFNIALPEHGQVNSFCVHDKKVYYAVEFTDYLLSTAQVGGESIPFEEKYNTQIRVFDSERNEDNVIYQYVEKKCVQITDLQCNGKVLVWEDYQEGIWQVQMISLDNQADKDPMTIYACTEDTGKLDSVTLTLSEKELYWYNQNEDLNNPIILYKYNFDDKVQTVVEEDLALSSPYEHVNIKNNVRTNYTGREDEKDTIRIYDGENVMNIEIGMNVSSPISNEKFCIWAEGYDYHERQLLYCFDRKENLFLAIPVADIFSYELIENIIIVNQEEGIICYDVSAKKVEDLTDVIGGKCGFLYSGVEGNIYTEVYEESEGILHIVNIEKKE